MLERSTTLPHAVICVQHRTKTSSSSSLYTIIINIMLEKHTRTQNNPSPASKGERVRHAVVINFDCKLSAHQNRTRYIYEELHYTKSIILIKIKKKMLKWSLAHTIEYCFPHMQFSYIIKLTHNTRRRRRRCDDERVKEARAPPHAHNHIFIVLIYRW